MTTAWRVQVWMKTRARNAGNLGDPAGPLAGPARPEAGSGNKGSHKSQGVAGQASNFPARRQQTQPGVGGRLGSGPVTTTMSRARNSR